MLRILILSFLPLQKKKVRRRKSQGKKKPPAPDTSPEALVESWKIVEEELKALGFQVSGRFTLSKIRTTWQIEKLSLNWSLSWLPVKRTTFTNTKYYFSVIFEQLSESLTEGIVPFDATSETPLEDQRTEAMVRVQDALLVRTGPEALGMLRAARSARLSMPLTPQNK